MARGKRVAEGKTLVVYSTKVLPETRARLDALAKVNGSEYYQRDLLDDMTRLYMAEYPEKAQKAQVLLQLLGHDELEMPGVAAGPVVDPAAAELAEGIMAHFDTVFDSQTKPKKVQTVRYHDSPKVHLYEPGSKNSTGCGLSGTIDPETIADLTPDAVTCGKCRYCRKAVFK